MDCEPCKYGIEPTISLDGLIPCSASPDEHFAESPVYVFSEGDQGGCRFS